ncbi:MAG: cytidine deaminase [bacterium]
MQDRERDILLIEKARQALRNAYAPYSCFRVGAAVVTDDGRFYMGCNVENASYGLTVCAERVAIFSAVADGKRRIEAIAVVAEGEQEIYPCGACLQVMSEFGIQRVLLGKGEEFNAYNLSDLLPRAFRLK